MTIDILFNIIGYSSSAIILTLGILMAFISVPKSEEWRDFRQMKFSLAIAYFVLILLRVVDLISESETGNVSLSQVEIFLVLFIAFLQALLFICTNLVFVRSPYVTRRNILINVLVIFIIGIAFMCSLGSEWFQPMRYITCALYIGQLVCYTYLFNKELKGCIKRLEERYEDDMRTRLYWISNCYYSALIIGVLALLCALLPIKKLYYNIFVITYTIYYAYILGKVYHYRLRAKFIVDTPIIEEVELKPEPITHVSDFEQKLNEWIKRKEYLKNDIAMDEIVEEFGVSRRFFSAYFTERYQANFRSWRMELRLKEAARILTEEDAVKISYLYDRVGFANEANFYREFKNMFGATPANYRAKLLK